MKSLEDFSHLLSKMDPSKFSDFGTMFIVFSKGFGGSLLAYLVYIWWRRTNDEKLITTLSKLGVKSYSRGRMKVEFKDDVTEKEQDNETKLRRVD